MKRKLKLISTLSTASLAMALAGCGGEGEGEGAEGEGAAPSAISAEGESEGAIAEGEGEGESEGEGAIGSGDPATDDVEYLYRLGLVRGHLAAFIELYRAGAYDMAAMHAKHPESEIYADLAPAFAARGATGFAGELATLANTAEARGDVEAVYEATVSAIRANNPSANVKTTLLAISKMAATAAEEFDIAVTDDGAIETPHEYQDAYGFLAASREMLSELETADINATEAIAITHEQIDLAMASFDGLVADTTEGEASTIYGASSRIEIAALGL